MYIKYEDTEFKRKRRLPIKGIVIHHTDTHNRAKRVLDKRKLSTHYEIDTNGDIYCYADPLKYVTSHCGQYNSYTVGIDLTHYRGEAFTDAQYSSLNELLDYLCVYLHITLNLAPETCRIHSINEFMNSPYSLFRHRNLALTRCPDNLDFGRLKYETV